MNRAKCGAMAVLTLLAVLFLSNCTEKNYTVNQPPTNSVHIHGTVRAWRCGVGDRWNNPHDPEQLRFSMNTGEPATVTFIRDNGFTSFVDTNDSSDVDLYLSAGSHRIVVETGYTYPPDTFHNVQLRPGDTTLVWDITYNVLDPWNIECVFSYSSIDDTASTKAEWDVIEVLNMRTYKYGKVLPVFNTQGGVHPGDFRRLIRSDLTPRVYVHYRMPVNRAHPGYGKLYNVLEAYGMLQDVIDKDTTGSFPPNFSIYPSGVYICMWQARSEYSPGAQPGARCEQMVGARGRNL